MAPGSAKKVINMIKSENLTDTELYEVHEYVGHRIKRRMYYQLVFTANGHDVAHDHTDRFKEVCMDLADRVIYYLNVERVRKLPRDTFTFDENGHVMSIKHTHMDEQSLNSIMTKYLPPELYYYVIHQFEVSF